MSSCLGSTSQNRRENACSNVTMNSTFLTFRDPSLERAFEKSQLLEFQRTVDLNFFRITTIVFYTVAFKNAHEHNFALIPGIPYLICGILATCLWIVYLRSPLDRLLKIRPIMSIAVRLSAAIAGAITSHFVTWQFQLDAWFPLSALQILMATETFGNLPYVFGMRIKFKQHLFVQIMAYVIFLFGKAPQICSKAMASPGADNFLLIDAFVDFVFELFFAFFCTIFGDDPTPEVTPKASCLHLTNFLMTYFSIIVISYIVWTSEKHSRIQFLKSRNLALEGIQTGVILFDYLTLLMVSVFYWHYSTSITSMLI